MLHIILFSSHAASNLRGIECCSDWICRREMLFHSSAATFRRSSTFVGFRKNIFSFKIAHIFSIVPSVKRLDFHNSGSPFLSAFAGNVLRLSFPIRRRVQWIHLTRCLPTRSPSYHALAARLLYEDSLLMVSDFTLMKSEVNINFDFWTNQATNWPENFTAELLRCCWIRSWKIIAIGVL